MHYFFRWNVIGEIFLDFSKPENYYNVPSLRKDTDESTSINYQLLNDKCHLLHDIIGFKSTKSKCIKLIMKLLLTTFINLVTHQNRGQGQRDLFSDGASLEEIKFFYIACETHVQDPT